MKKSTGLANPRSRARSIVLEIAATAARRAVAREKYRKRVAECRAREEAYYLARYPDIKEFRWINGMWQTVYKPHNS